MTTAYLDTPSGISGDMFLGCLVDAGWPIDELRAVIQRVPLPVEEWKIDAKVVMKGPMRATLVEVDAREGHHHRHLKHIREIIEKGDLPPTVKERATATFARLAEAEAKVHGTTVDRIHFHEVGAVDAIIDILGVCAGLHALGVEKLHASALPMGEGWANTAHGQIPLPAPATLELLAAAGAPTRPAPGAGEWVTPTGAALVATLATFGQPPLQLSRIGTGAGQRNAPWPNVARLWLGAAGDASGGGGGGLVELQTNIDDMNPQLFTPLSDRLFAAGAKDVWLTPVQMKKGRPAVVVSVLTDAALEPVMTDLLLRETTTLGVRSLPLRHRHAARRETRHVHTEHGTVHVKVKWLGQDPVGATPEYDDCVKRATAANLPVKQVHDAALAAAFALLDELRKQAPPAAAPAAHEPHEPHDHPHHHHHHHDHDHPHDHDHDHHPH